MRALLIDPARRTVEHVDYDGSLDQAYALLGCSCIDARRLDDGNTLFVDDEGVLHADRRWFAVLGAGRPFAGRGLIIGPEEATGRIRDVQRPFAVKVEFPTPLQAARMWNAQGREDRAAMNALRAQGITVIDCGMDLPEEGA